jgi:hypothetical protein
MQFSLLSSLQWADQVKITKDPFKGDLTLSERRLVNLIKITSKESYINWNNSDYANQNVALKIRIDQ